MAFFHWTFLIILKLGNGLRMPQTRSDQQTRERKEKEKEKCQLRKDFI